MYCLYRVAPPNCVGIAFCRRETGDKSQRLDFNDDNTHTHT